jgi:hypothetical protein
VRLAILISLAALAAAGPRAMAGDALVPCDVGDHGGYLVPVSYAEAHEGDIMATLPDGPELDSFWRVTEQAAVVADRHLRETLEDAAKDPTLLFPSLTPGGGLATSDSIDYQKQELRLTLEHYPAYLRQYVGLVIAGHKIVLLNYVIGSKLDPSEGYILIHRKFETGRTHFLEARFDWDERRITNVSLYGSWQDAPR